MRSKGWSLCSFASNNRNQNLYPHNSNYCQKDSKKQSFCPKPKMVFSWVVVRVIYNCMNRITMSNPTRTPKPKQTNETKLPPSYKVIFSVLKPANKGLSIDRKQKVQITLASPSRTAAGPFFTGSKEKRPLIPFPASTKHPQVGQSFNPSKPLTVNNDQDLRIDLKSFRRGQVDIAKTEQVVEGRMMFQSERKMGEGSPQRARLTSRCLEIEDIILNAPFFSCKEGSRGNGSKVIRLKRPDK